MKTNLIVGLLFVTNSFAFGLLMPSTVSLAAKVESSTCEMFLANDSALDCRESVFPKGIQLHLSCKLGNLLNIDEEWRKLTTYNESNQFLLLKLKSLGPAGFSGWAACQGAHVQVEAWNDGAVEINAVFYSISNPRLKKITENWSSWCVEGGTLLGWTAEILGGCYIPSNYDMIAHVGANGVVQYSAFGSNYSY